jgi:hypothetical protein
MERPPITPEQKEMAVTLLANALRKDAYLRTRARGAGDPGDPLHDAFAKRRAEPSRRYVEGMRDLLRVLFPDGHAVADECLEAAYARAIGAPTHTPNGRSGSRYH